MRPAEQAGFGRRDRSRAQAFEAGRGREVRLPAADDDEREEVRDVAAGREGPREPGAELPALAETTGLGGRERERHGAVFQRHEVELDDGVVDGGVDAIVVADEPDRRRQLALRGGDVPSELDGVERQQGRAALARGDVEQRRIAAGLDDLDLDAAEAGVGDDPFGLDGDTGAHKAWRHARQDADEDPEA
ncbi:hypothetical protein [Nannocystis exedens]|uniref:hypothetical protein n=1 Tax=Nannocystis exedens TaxID=54 RepID=UPI00116041E0|nr:hypothetical protein [Nannocystis exedens]